MKLLLLPTTALVAVFSVMPAWSYSCVGTIDSVGVSPGTRWVIFSSSSVGFASVYLCLLESTTTSNNGNVTPGQCKTMLGTLQIASRNSTKDRARLQRFAELYDAPGLGAIDKLVLWAGSLRTLTEGEPHLEMIHWTQIREIGA